MRRPEITSALASGAVLVLTGQDRAGDALADLIPHGTSPMRRCRQPCCRPASDLPLSTLIVAGEACAPEMVQLGPPGGDSSMLMVRPKRLSARP